LLVLEEYRAGHWDPSRGSFKLWAKFYIRKAMTWHSTAAASGGLVGQSRSASRRVSKARPGPIATCYSPELMEQTVSGCSSVEDHLDISARVSTLCERDQQIVHMYWEGHTVREIAERTGLSHQRISQIVGLLRAA